jgi:hydroxymethylbilane synthase
VSPSLRIGTRGSRLALAQAEEVATRLREAGRDAELVPIVTSGDRGASARDSPAGLKGVFVAEIVRALQRGEVDLAVHSAKDLPAEDPDDVVVGGVPTRANAFDVIVTRDGGRLGPDVVVGTSSLRRRAQLLARHPRLRVVPLRGNVDTRLRKLEGGEVDAIVLAAAGLARLGIVPPSFEPLPIEEMVPAPGQGALAIQVRADDTATRQALIPLLDPASHAAFEAERELMRLLGGGCALPLGAHATAAESGIDLVALVASPDGRTVLREEVDGHTPGSAAARATERLRAAGADEVLALARAEGRG